MKKTLFNTLLLLMFMLGLSILLYPTVSDYWNSKIRSRAIIGYRDIVDKMDEDDLNPYFKEADYYNLRLSKLAFPLLDYEELDGYDKMLDIGKDGPIGYITIGKLQLELPIYRGTSASVLNMAVGHVEGTSIPVGGLGTHSALTAHRGLPSSQLFSHLDKLYEGDIFILNILNRELVYEVDQVKIVKPNDSFALAIEADKDLCTLITCTPYGINTHRLLVRGKRTDSIDDKKELNLKISPEAYKVDPFLLIVICASIMFTLLFVLFLIKNREEQKKESLYNKAKDSKKNL